MKRVCVCDQGGIKVSHRLCSAALQLWAGCQGKTTEYKYGHAKQEPTC